MPLEQPLVVVAAGIAGGFAYWAVAGFSAGFYKPIFRTIRRRASPQQPGNQGPLWSRAAQFFAQSASHLRATVSIDRWNNLLGF